MPPIEVYFSDKTFFVNNNKFPDKLMEKPEPFQIQNSYSNEKLIDKHQTTINQTDSQ